jgi:hypothetical protein
MFNSYSARIREDEYILMREYCVKNKPQILTTAKDLGSIATEILIEGFNAHGMPVAEFLQEEDNLLTTHFESYRRVSAQGGEPPISSLEVPGLEHPAEVAHSLQPLNMGTIPLEGPMVALKRTAYEPGTTAPADALFHDSASHGIMHPQPLVNQNLDNGCTLQAQWQQAQQHIVNSHAVQHSWRPDADLNWVQGISAPQARFNSALGPPLDQSGQDGGPTGGTTADSTNATDWGWNYSTWLNDQL